MMISSKYAIENHCNPVKPLKLTVESMFENFKLRMRSLVPMYLSLGEIRCCKFVNVSQPNIMQKGHSFEF